MPDSVGVPEAWHSERRWKPIFQPRRGESVKPGGVSPRSRGVQENNPQPWKGDMRPRRPRVSPLQGSLQDYGPNPWGSRPRLYAVAPPGLDRHTAPNRWDATRIPKSSFQSAGREVLARSFLACARVCTRARVPLPKAPPPAKRVVGGGRRGEDQFQIPDHRQKIPNDR